MISQFITSLFVDFYTFFAQMLRKLISSPRNRHSDPLSSTSLDLAYLTPNLITMSTPASSFPKTLWRNPAEDVKKFLDANHPDMWRVWSLRGEGSDYLDKDLDGKVEHFGWPDHHPPPFEYIKPLLDSIHTHLKSNERATAVLHCKAGKGRSGTIAVSYLVTHENWPSGKALKHFTTQRMRFGEGVSIPSQRRWVRYVELWARKLGCEYTQGTVEVTRIQFWGMKIGDGGNKVEVGIAGFVDGQHPGAKTVNKIHVFQDSERTMEGNVLTYTPATKIQTTSDMNMFLTRHRLLHESESVPRIPLSISHCWINTYLERKKLVLNDFGYNESAEEMIKEPEVEVTADAPLTDQILPDAFKTKPNLDRKASIPTTDSPAEIGTPANGSTTKLPLNGGTSSSSSRKSKKSEISPMKDRDWRGEENGEIWWETVWEGMDGIGGTNKKGKKCFDRVRIWWREVPQSSSIPKGEIAS